MVVLADRQLVAAGELSKWREDVADGVGSRIVLLRVPRGWGRSRVLDWLAEALEPVEGEPVTFLFRVAGRELPEGRGSQAAAIRDLLADAGTRHPVAKALGLDRPAGVAVLGIGVGSLFVSGLGALAGMLLAQEAVTAAGNVRDASAAGQVSVLGRLARSAAQVSGRVPVVVLIDDADCLDLNLALVLLENLTFRDDGKMLIVAAADPRSPLAEALSRGDRTSLVGRVFAVDVDPDMGPEPRTALARELCPGLGDALARRIGQRTATFADVYAVGAAERVAELGSGRDQANALTVVDAVIDVVMRRAEPSAAAVMVAWAGGVVHARQVDRALAVTGQLALAADPDLERSGTGQGAVVRLADPASPRLAAPVAALAGRVRWAMAVAVVEQAIAVCADSSEPVVGRIVAGRAAHRVRGDLTEHDLGNLVKVQCDLVAGLEAVGDLAEAAKVAAEALAGCPDDRPHLEKRNWLAAAVLRLAHAAISPDEAPLVRQLINEAIAGGAAVGLEARVWAATSLLGMADRREDGGRLAEQVAADLDSATDLGPQAIAWRLQLALQAGRADRPEIMQRLLAPLLAAEDGSQRDLATRVLHAADDPRADIRLQIALLESELQTGPASDDRLRIHHALAHAYDKLGDYHQALDHAQHELPLRISLQGANHHDSLVARSDVARWTGLAGDRARARDLYAELLPVMERVFGPEHPDTQAVLYGLAFWAGLAGDPARARDLYAELLRIRERISRPEDPDTLAARVSFARWTGEAGDPARARDLHAELTPVMERVSGPEHPDTLVARTGFARWTGAVGDPARARDLYAEALPVMKRVFGPEHPDTLTGLHGLAYWTGEAGDPARARDLYAELLPLMERISGPEDPDTLVARNAFARWTGAVGDPARARDLYAELLRIRERVSGPAHPDTLAARINFAACTGLAGDPARARDLYAEALPVMERVLGPEHPITLVARQNLQYLTRKPGKRPH